jgi:membrane-bound serine protease (ClpP class)
VLLVLVELFFFPGSVIFAIAGLCLMFGSLLWAMVDFWPSETGPINLSPEMFAEPLFNLIFGVGIAVAGALLVSRLLPGSVFERLLVLGAAAGGDSGALRKERDAHLPAVGSEGVAVTPLYPSGDIEVDGQRYDARCAIGMIERGAKVRVLQSGDFGLLVEEMRT